MKPTMQIQEMLLDEAIVPEQEWLLVEHRGIQKRMSIYTLVAGRGLPLEMNSSLDGSERWRYTYPDSSYIVIPAKAGIQRIQELT